MDMVSTAMAARRALILGAPYSGCETRLIHGGRSYTTARQTYQFGEAALQYAVTNGEVGMVLQVCALAFEFLPDKQLSRVIIWEMAPARVPEIIDVMEGEFAELLNIVMSRYEVRYLVTPQNSLREGDPATIWRLAKSLHAYFVDFQHGALFRAEPPEPLGTDAVGVDVATAPVVQQVLNLRCRVILDNDLRTMGALRAVMDRMAASLVNRLMPVVRSELDTIIDALIAADFEAAFTAQVTVEPANQSHRELARAIGETRQ